LVEVERPTRGAVEPFDVLRPGRELGLTIRRRLGKLSVADHFLI